MTDKPKSILGQVRADGYREGWGQASQLEWDEAYHEGWVDGRVHEASVHRYWLCAGVLIGGSAAILTGIFVS